MKHEVFILEDRELIRREEGMVERLWEMSKWRRERIEKGSRERIEKRERDKKLNLEFSRSGPAM